MSEERQSWHEYFFSIAEKAATRSTCLRRKVGAVAVNERNRIIGTGYNGAPSGMEHCTSKTCIRIANEIPSGTALETCYALHAEQNLVVQLGEQLQYSSVYCTNQPCSTCIKLLLGSGVSKVYWKNPYPDEFSKLIMGKAGRLFDNSENDSPEVAYYNTRNIREVNYLHIPPRVVLFVNKKNIPYMFRNQIPTLREI